MIFSNLKTSKMIYYCLNEIERGVSDGGGGGGGGGAGTSLRTE